MSVRASLTFIVPSSEKPRVLVSDGAEENRRTGEFRSLPVTISDARGLAQPASLDREGFALAKSPTRVTDFYDNSAVEQVYYPEIVDMLKRMTGASGVHIFDHTLRVEDEAKRRAAGTRSPVSFVHNDYTERSGPERLRSLLEPEAAERLLATRFAIVNVWRSFGLSAERFPLAAADGRSVASNDFIAVDMMYPDRIGEIYYNAYSDGQLWFYFSNMQRNEAMLLKCFDSARDGRTRYTAHTGFANPNALSDTPPRESIEVRTLLSFA